MRILPAEMYAFFLSLRVMDISAGISSGPPSDAFEERLSVSHPRGGEVTHFLWEAENSCEWFWPHAWHTVSVPWESDK